MIKLLMLFYFQVSKGYLKKLSFSCLNLPVFKSVQCLVLPFYLPPSLSISIVLPSCPFPCSLLIVVFHLGLYYPNAKLLKNSVMFYFVSVS